MKNLEVLVKRAVSGEKEALEKVVENIQDLIYNLAIRMPHRTFIRNKSR